MGVSFAVRTHHQPRPRRPGVVGEVSGDLRSQGRCRTGHRLKQQLVDSVTGEAVRSSHPAPPLLTMACDGHGPASLTDEHPRRIRVLARGSLREFTRGVAAPDYLRPPAPGPQLSPLVALFTCGSSKRGPNGNWEGLSLEEI